ncbi:MAG: hypothetical protein AAFP89_23280, partial [Bacteroidota bacterium]
MLEKRKLWKLMRLFDKREQSKVGYWLKGELRGHHGATYQLFELMCDPEVSIEQIWVSLYPHKALPERPFYDSSFRRLEHSLSGLLETWLAIQSLRKNEEEIDLHVLRELDVRESKELFESKYKKTKRKLEAQPTRDDSYHRKMLRLKMELLPFTIKYDIQSYSAALLEVIEQFHITSFHEQCRYAMLIVNYLYSDDDDRYKQKFQKYFDACIDSQRLKYFNHDPILRIYDKLILLQSGEGSSDGLEKDLRDHLYLFSRSSQGEVYAVFMNHHLRKSPVRDGGVEYCKQTVELIEWGMKERLVYVEDTIRDIIFRVLISSCIGSNQIELGEYYLETLKENLLKEIKEENYTYCKGLIRMAQKRYKEALKLLNKKFPRLAIDLRARKRVILIQYEMGQRVELENEIRTLILCIERVESLNSRLRKSL